MNSAICFPFISSAFILWIPSVASSASPTDPWRPVSLSPPSLHIYRISPSSTVSPFLSYPLYLLIYPQLCTSLRLFWIQRGSVSPSACPPPERQTVIKILSRRSFRSLVRSSRDYRIFAHGSSSSLVFFRFLISFLYLFVIVIIRYL